MSYIINKSDGTTLTTVNDGDIDTASSSVTFIGRTAINYGLSHNDNFLHLLENFANTVAPAHPLAGQLWFDTTAKVLKVYKDGTWSALGGIGGDGGNNGLSTIYSVTISVPATSVMVMVAGGEIVLVIASVNVLQANLPITLTIDGISLPFRARFPDGLEAGTTLAIDPDDYVYKGNVITQSDTSYVVGGGTPLAAVTFIDLGTDSILLNVAGSQIISAYSHDYILQSALPANVLINGVTVPLQSAFPNGLGSAATTVTINGTPTNIPARGGLTMANNFGIIAASSSSASGITMTDVNTAIATATQGIYTWVDTQSAVAVAYTNLSASFISATGAASLSTAIQQLSTYASAGNTAATDLVSLKSALTSVTGQTSYATAVGAIWTKAGGSTNLIPDTTFLTGWNLATGATRVASAAGGGFAIGSVPWSLQWTVPGTSTASQESNTTPNRPAITALQIYYMSVDIQKTSLVPASTQISIGVYAHDSAGAQIGSTPFATRTFAASDMVAGDAPKQYHCSGIAPVGAVSARVYLYITPNNAAAGALRFANPRLSTDPSSISAGWSVTLDVNGYVAGLSLVNGGQDLAEFNIAVDKFRVSTPGTSFVPFLIENGIVKMHNVEIDTLKVGTIITDHIVGGAVTTLLNFDGGTQYVSQSPEVTLVESTTFTVGDASYGSALAVIFFTHQGLDHDTGMYVSIYTDTGGGYVLQKSVVFGIACRGADAYWTLPVSIPLALNGINGAAVKIKVTAHAGNPQNGGTGYPCYATGITLSVFGGKR